MGERQFRVVVQYRFRSKRPGVSLGMTITAESEEDAIDKAVAQHVTPYKARVFLAARAEAQP